MLVVALCAALLGAAASPAATPAVASAAPPPAAIGTTTATPPPSTGATMARLAEGAATARFRYLEGDFAGAVAAAAGVDTAFRGQAESGCTETSHPQGCQRGPAFAADPGAWDAWADAQATRALASQRLGNDADSDAVQRALITVRPAWSPDKGFVPPKQLARFEEIRQGLLAGATVPITFTGGSGDVVLDGRVVKRDIPLDVIPGTHFVGTAGLGRTVAVTAATRVVLGAPSPAPSTTPPDIISPEDHGSSWLLVAAGAGVVAVVAGVAVGVVLALQPREIVENPGGVTVFVDASNLNRPAGATP